jgi:hypothetical protein
VALDTAAVPEDRFITVSLEGSCYIWDRALGRKIKHFYYSERDDVRAKAKTETDRLNRETSAASSSVETGHADRAERYRHALAQIWRYSACPIAQRYAEDALHVQGRVTKRGE